MTAVQSTLRTKAIRPQLRRPQTNLCYCHIPDYSCRQLSTSACSTRTSVGGSSRTAATIAATGSISADKATEPLDTQTLTPRQRRLAQQRRKWEEAQQQKSRPQGSADLPSFFTSISPPAPQPHLNPTSASSRTPKAPPTTITITSTVRTASSLPTSRAQRSDPAPPDSNPMSTSQKNQKRRTSGSGSDSSTSTQHRSSTALGKPSGGSPSAPRPPPPSSSRAPSSPQSSPTSSPYTLQQPTATATRIQPQPTHMPTAVRHPSTTNTSDITRQPSSPPPSANSPSSSPSAIKASVPPFTSKAHSVTHPKAQPSQHPQTLLPNLLSAAANGSDTADLASLPTPQLVALAGRWAQEIVDWERQRLEESHRMRSAREDALMNTATSREVSLPLSGHHGGMAAAGHQHPGVLQQQVVPDEQRGAIAVRHGGATDLKDDSNAGHQVVSEGTGDEDWCSLRRQLPAAVVGRLVCLTAAVDARVAAGSLEHQELADLAWSVAHYDRGHAMQVLMPAMDVPFAVLPRFMPELRLEDFMGEVELRRDVVYLDDGTRAVEEARLTGWQSEIGATFRYSGKEMQPQSCAQGLTPAIRQVRDALSRQTGVQYDSVLINYYADGKCGMRYHVDPLYDRWTPNSAVVSLGDTRTFIFRAINDFNTRWQYRVRNGDVVLMYGDCQERLQHCVRVERHAADAGPRMSLVFKERRRRPDGAYLLD